MTERICSIGDCTKTPHARGMCGMHYRRSRVNGSPEVVKFIKGDDEARFWSYVDKDGPVPEHRPDLGACWLWTGALTFDGYGRIEIGGREGGGQRAHRWAYLRFVGPIEDDLPLDHLCHTRACVNFETHLEPVTQAENTQRRQSMGGNFRKADA